MHPQKPFPAAGQTAASKAIATVLIAFTLTACGGGGSSATGSGSGVAVPTNLIPGTGTGVRDTAYQDGCTGNDCFSGNVKTTDNSVYTDGVTLGYRRLQDARGNNRRLTVPNPPQDVRDAWIDGWTGEDVNTLVIDAFGGPEVPTHSGDRRGTHGYTVYMALREIADGARIFAMEAGLSSDGGGTGRGYRQSHIPRTPSNPTGGGANPNNRIQVINMSFGVEADNHYAGPGELNAYWSGDVTRALYADLTARTIADTEPFLTNTADAVLTKAAGNNGGKDAAHYIDNLALIDHQHTDDRTLIVGALTHYARASTENEGSNVSSAARMASYSAYAGGHGGMQRRFLVEYGGTPYGAAAHLVCDETVSASEGCRGSQDLDNQYHTQPLVGTSFAAPRVAGFAALVRDKFPGLSGAQTAEILLDTATTVGLACHTGTARKSPACSRAIYGQGRVSIGDALSPMGKLD